MSTELLFFTQVASLLTFLGTVFVLYRLLVKQKDATIEGRFQVRSATLASVN